MSRLGRLLGTSDELTRKALPAGRDASFSAPSNSTVSSVPANRARNGRGAAPSPAVRFVTANSWNGGASVPPPSLNTPSSTAW